jgi:hypothetical protein
LNPILFSFEIFGRTIELHWYGLLVALGVAVAAWLAEREIKRRGENPEHVWNALLWLLPIGIVGARLWYVANTTLGGNTALSRKSCKNPYRLGRWPAFLWRVAFWRNHALFLRPPYKLDMWLFLDRLPR